MKKLSIDQGGWQRLSDFVKKNVYDGKAKIPAGSAGS